MHHNGVVIAAVVFFAPHVEEETVGAHYLAAVFAEAPENGEFGGREGQGLFV